MLKEYYYSEENIGFESRRIISELSKFVKIKKLEFNPSRSVLLVLDMQKVFLDESSHSFIPSSRAIIPNLRLLIQDYKRRGFPVLMTRHINSFENAGTMKKWWNSLILEEDPCSELMDEFKHLADLVIKKSQYDAFYKTNLEELLRDRGVEQVVITGVMTHLCCETTARSAFIRGFEVFFVVDATATYNYQFHFSSLLNLAHGFVVPVLTEDLLGRI